MSLPTTDDATLRTSDTEQEMWDLVEGGNPAEARQAYPSGWLWLTGEESVRTLLGSLLDEDSDAHYGIDDLASISGLSNVEVEQSVDALLSLGVLVADDGIYQVNEHAIVWHAAGELSDAVAATDAPDEESGFEYLGQTEDVRLMLDALLEAEPDQSLTQEEVHQLTGVSRKRVWLHVEKLVELEVISESGDEYVVDAYSPVLRWAQSLDAAVVGAALATSHP